MNKEMNYKKKILILATGGTIASEPSENGLVPAIDVNNLLRSLDEITDNYDITAKDILHLDSSNIQPEEWVFIANNIYKEYQGFDGIVITHGTIHGFYAFLYAAEYSYTGRTYGITAFNHPSIDRCCGKFEICSRNGCK